MSNLQKIKQKNLNSFLKTDLFVDSKVLPISTHRAISQTLNPYSSPDDVLLYVKVEAGQIVAYLGTFPAIFNLSGSSYKGAWLSCIWVDESQRGKGLAKKMVTEAYNDWNQRIFITEFTDKAEKLYEKLGFFKPLSQKSGLRIYNRMMLGKILPPKSVLFQKTVGLLKVFDFCCNLFLDIRFLSKQSGLSNMRVERLTYLNQETENFIRRHNSEYLFPKDIQYYQWVIDNPWILSSTVASQESKKYHFSSIAKNFTTECYTLYNEQNELAAFLIFTKRDGFLKLPVALYSDPQLVTNFLNKFIDKSVHTFTIFDPFLIENLKSKGIYRKVFFKKHLCSLNDTLLKKANEKVMENGDGDSCFT